MLLKYNIQLIKHNFKKLKQLECIYMFKLYYMTQYDILHCKFKFYEDQVHL